MPDKKLTDAEIERLQEKNFVLSAKIDGVQEANAILREYIENAKAEAIKEFTKFCIDKSKNGVISVDDIADYAVDFVNSGHDMTVLTERIGKEC